MNAKSLIMMDESATASAADGKVKAEIGEVGRETPFTVAFEINNISDEDLIFDFDAEFFTQIIADGLRLEQTTALEASLVWTIDGKTFEQGDGGFDFDGNGLVNYFDAQYLLEYIAGNVEEIEHLESADFDEDGDVDTYDAYLAFKALNSATAAVAAGEKIEVAVEVTLFVPEELDVNGNWIEGYVTVLECNTEDGAIGVKHTIPVLGFYGNFTEASMFDKHTSLEYDYETEEEPLEAPYMSVNTALGSSAYYVGAFVGSDGYYLGGNPFVLDEEYHPERNAINPQKNSVGSVLYTQIRNAAAIRFYAANQYGRVVNGSEQTAVTPTSSAYYSH